MILDALKFGYGALRDVIGRNDARAAERRSNARDDTKVRRLVADARAAGIHPLAAMGSQVAGAFGTPGSVYTGNAAGEALSSSRSPDPLQVENARLQNESLKADIERTRADTARIIASSATSRSAIGRASAGNRGITTSDRSAIMGAGPWPDAEDYQTRYGELAEWLFGPQILVSDVHAAAKKHMAKQPYKGGGSQWTVGRK